MDRFAKFFCDPFKVLKLLFAVLAGAVVIFYVYHQVAGGVDDKVETEMSILVDINDSVSADAYVFRDEYVLQNSVDGVVVTLVSDGDRVSKGQMIANIYTDESDAALQDDINRLQRRLDVLEDSSVDNDFVISDITKLDNEITEVLTDIYSDSSKGNLASVIDSSSQLLVKFNKRDLIVDSDFDFSSEKEKIETDMSSLEARISSVSTPVIAPSAGYFYGEVDGYEDVFLTDSVSNMNLGDFEELTHSKSENVSSENGLKIVRDFVWYLVCSVDTEQLVNLKTGNNYTVSFPENADYKMDMLLDRVVKETDSSKALAIFRVNVLPEQFDYKRYQKAEIVLNEKEGLTVPKKAFRVVNGVEGVYILVGDVVRFRKIERIGEKDNYYIVRYDSNPQYFEDENLTDNIPYLSLYDNIIVSGKNLFDGKIVG